MLTLPHLTEHYDVSIIDLWGVIHDGTALYPKAKDTLHALRKAGIKLALLSNAPRRASKARDVLRNLSIEDSMYDMLLTSGEEAFLQLTSDTSRFGTRYYYLGPSKDEDVLADAPAYTRAEHPADADFVLNTGFEVDFQPQDAIMPTLQHLLAYNLPLLCINPDREVVKLDGTHMLCAGVVAGMYEALGGPVHRIGKPYLAVYERILHALNISDTSRVLAFGDSATTDILGANRAGIDSVLITGGIMAVSHPNISEEKARSECAVYGATPTFILPHFAL